MTKAVGAPDILVNNAAVTFLRPLDEFPDKRARLMIEMHVLAPLQLTQWPSPPCASAGGGGCSVSSLAASASRDRLLGVRPQRRFRHVRDLKAALSRLAQSFAAELYDDGIAVNAATTTKPVRTPGAGTLDLAKADTEDISSSPRRRSSSAPATRTP